MARNHSLVQEKLQIGRIRHRTALGGFQLSLTFSQPWTSVSHTMLLTLLIDPYLHVYKKTPYRHS
ncbi:hypothetical protein [Paenibacillus sp. FSL E2-0201]|uniref:hypothetical protein n=1 Tax=Paenibacillus sp. FSL E2-0201 TaxID=2954726 RepID=UPI0030DDDCDD